MIFKRIGTVLINKDSRLKNLNTEHTVFVSKALEFAKLSMESSNSIDFVDKQGFERKQIIPIFQNVNLYLREIMGKNLRINMI